jgi:hypothetical protein
VKVYAELDKDAKMEAFKIARSIEIFAVVSRVVSAHNEIWDFSINNIDRAPLRHRHQS